MVEVESGGGEERGRKKKRADAGVSQATPRDLLLLSWVSDMYAVRLDHLQVLAGRYSPVSYKKTEGILSKPVCRKLVSRWVNLEIGEWRRILHGQPIWIWASKKGLEVAGVDYPYRKPSIGRLRHMHAVNGVRLHIEEKILKGEYMPYKRINWTSDRVVNLERKDRGKRHIVDGELFFQNKTIAIEVELTAKSQPRLKSILSELRKDYDAIWYFVSAEARGAVEKALGGVSRNDKFILYELPDLCDYGWD